MKKIITILLFITLSVTLLTNCTDNKDAKTTLSNSPASSSDASAVISSNDTSSSTAISAANVDVTGVSLSAADVNLPYGTYVTLSATVSPDNATDKSIMWSTSDKAIVTVDNGKVTAVGYGSATVTATSANGKTADCKFTVAKLEGSTGGNSGNGGGSTGGGNTAPAVPATPDTGAVPPAGFTGGLTYNAALSDAFNAKTGENKNTAYFNTLFNDSLKIALGQDTFMNVLINKYGKVIPFDLYTDNGVGYEVTPYDNTVCNVNSNNADTLCTAAQNAGLFKFTPEFINNGYEVYSQRFVWTYILYDPDNHTNKLFRVVWYVMKTPKAVS